MHGGCIEEGLSVRKVVVALGGNAIEDPAGNTGIDFSRVTRTASVINRLSQQGYLVAVTHGNGPQVGEILRFFLKEKHPLSSSLDVMGAMTQGEIGYVLCQAIQNATGKTCVVVNTRVLVSAADESFAEPTKPIGRYLTETEAEELRRLGYRVKSFLVNGSTVFRQVVPSPRPLSVLEKDVIRNLVEAGTIVVACGGGGVPVVIQDGKIVGVNAVVDKDRASAKLASAISADLLIILTDVESVMIDYGKPTQRPVSKLTVEEAEQLIRKQYFPEGSMGPKVEACTEFVKQSNGKAIITSPEKIDDALSGLAGTIVVGN
jgi:carbamate kinase